MLAFKLLNRDYGKGKFDSHDSILIDFKATKEIFYFKH